MGSIDRARLGWYARRLGRMSPAEVGWRVGDRLRQEAWRRRRFDPERAPAGLRPPSRRTAPSLPAGTDLRAAGEASRRDLVAEAERLVAGRATVLGVDRHDMADPSWALDPASGHAYPTDRCAFRIDYRGPADPRSVKQVWELSRHHHLTVLACAWRLTGDDRYAELVERHLRSWWRANPVLAGVNWASGIELGIRLVAWAWIRRLLDGWPGAPRLFEEDPVAVGQIYWHQRYLAGFRSRGSSANNHVVAEAAGWLVAACAFPWFAESDRWRAAAARLLEDELERNVGTDGVDREQAFDYHGLVAELGLAAAAEAQATGTPLPDRTWTLLCRMVDAAAAVVDRAGGAPRFGDGDDGRALVVTGPATDRWGSLLATGAAVFGPLPWWPATTPDPQSVLLAALVGRRVPVAGRPEVRPSHFADAGLTILRSPPGVAEELWCRCDGGPHGFLSIAAHAHADALSVELRHDGVPLLVDPGTYCYHGQPAWRRYFRSTVGHNTLELDGQDQSVAGGPFLWQRAATTRLLAVEVGPGRQRWSAEHDGYRRLDPPATHRRTVALDPAAGTLEVVDRVDSAAPHDLRLAFHLGADVAVGLDGHRALLRWPRPGGGPSAGNWATGTLDLPPQLRWTAHRGATDPVLGWYSPGFGRRRPTTTLLGTASEAATTLRTAFRLTG